jgi:hypothetical protein
LKQTIDHQLQRPGTMQLGIYAGRVPRGDMVRPIRRKAREDVITPGSVEVTAQNHLAVAKQV